MKQILKTFLQTLQYLQKNITKLFKKEILDNSTGTVFFYGAANKHL